MTSDSKSFYPLEAFIVLPLYHHQPSKGINMQLDIREFDIAQRCSYGANKYQARQQRVATKCISVSYIYIYIQKQCPTSLFRAMS